MKRITQVSLGLLLSLPLVAAAEPAPVVYNGPVVNLSSPPPALLPLPTPVPRSVEERAEVTQDPADDPHQRGLSLGGPRFGISYIEGGGLERLRTAVKKAKPEQDVEAGMTQFGWQVEYRMFRTTSGITALTEVVPLVGGMDQGLALPSVTWLLGLRGKKGFELGVGPNLGLDGTSMMVGGGYTFDLGGINVPLNLAYGQGAGQTHSTSVSVGFNL